MVKKILKKYKKWINANILYDENHQNKIRILEIGRII